MRRRYILTPSLEFIERSLLGVSDGLIEAVERGETSPGIAAAVRQSPEWAEHVALNQQLAANAGDLSATQEVAEASLPDFIRDLIRRKAAANSLPETAPPAPGQIVSVEKIVTSRPDELDAFMSSPLFVLLDGPAELPGLWHGWLASGETDYASWWDFVLQEVDEPFDPAAGMVQLWNPVQLYLPQAGRIVAVLSSTRLQAIRALAAEFVTSQAPTDVPVWPGRVATRTTTGGMQVQTGSPLGGEDDPRHRYQQIYLEAAEAVKEPARIAMRKLGTVPEGPIGTLMNQLIAAASRLKEVLAPEPRVAVAMSASVTLGATANLSILFSSNFLSARRGAGLSASAEPTSTAPDLVWPDVARIRILDLTEAGAGRVEVSAIGTEPVTTEIRYNGQLEDRVVIEPGGRDIASWNEAGASLSLTTPSGRSLILGPNASS